VLFRSRRRQIKRVADCETLGEKTFYLYRLALRDLPAEPHFEDFAEACGKLRNIARTDEFPDWRLAALMALLELYRRKVAPYEDRKAAENGDVFGGEGSKK